MLIRKILLLPLLLICIAPLAFAQDRESIVRDIEDIGGNPNWKPNLDFAYNTNATIFGNNYCTYSIDIEFRNAGDAVVGSTSLLSGGTLNMVIPANTAKICVRKKTPAGPWSCILAATPPTYPPTHQGSSLTTTGIFILIGLLLVATIYIYSKKKAESAG